MFNGIKKDSNLVSIFIFLGCLLLSSMAFAAGTLKFVWNGQDEAKWEVYSDSKRLYYNYGTGQHDFAPGTYTLKIPGRGYSDTTFNIVDRKITTIAPEVGTLKFIWNGQDEAKWEVYSDGKRLHYNYGTEQNDFALGTYTLKIPGRGYSDTTFTIVDRKITTIAPEVGTLKFVWNGQHEVKWEVYSDGKRLYYNYGTEQHDFAPGTYALKISNKGYSDGTFTIFSGQITKITR